MRETPDSLGQKGCIGMRRGSASSAADAFRRIGRRQLLQSIGAGVLGAHVTGGTNAMAAPPDREGTAEGASLTLRDFEPKSALHARETRVPKSRFPAIDAHSHLSSTAGGEKGVAQGEEVELLIAARDAVTLMDRKNVRAMVNLTGGHGKGLEKTLAAFDRAFPGRFYTCTEPSYEHFLDPRYPQMQADAVAAAARAGARGLKILKTLGLYLRENVTSGPLVKVDDKRFDPMWEACAAAKLPVFIHVADPEAFFTPVDRFNERYDELGFHPDWSFHGHDFPSFTELMAARDRLYARHPRTQFLSLHVGHDAENLEFVGASLDRFPNMTVELGARVGELGRQPRASRRFFEKYQDRILFGTDAVPPPEGEKYPQQVFKDELYEIYYRFLETEDEYFDYAPAKVPPQGRWRIYGIGLPETILKKVYEENAVRVLGLSS
jgi:predicted TIM-barrel fold metal-dependent hydrolase